MHATERFRRYANIVVEVSPSRPGDRRIIGTEHVSADPFGAFMPDSVLNRLDIHRTPTSVRPIYIHSEVIVRVPGFTFDYPGKPRLCEKPFQFTKVKPVSMLVRLAQLIC